jgi:hypothetical protein
MIAIIGGHQRSGADDLIIGDPQSQLRSAQSIPNSVEGRADIALEFSVERCNPMAQDTMPPLARDKGDFAMVWVARRFGQSGWNAISFDHAG